MDFCAISCPKENEPDRCVDISCTCFHMHPRYINGLFLPSTSNIIGSLDYQEWEEKHTDFEYTAISQGDMCIPIHPFLVFTLNASEDDDESDKDENKNEDGDNIEPRVKTSEEIEEEKMLINIYRQAGQYYKVSYSFEIPLPNAMDRKDQMHFNASKDPQEDGDFTFSQGSMHEKELSMDLSSEKQQNDS
ncbi:hypothetical protein XENTR_v10008036 [Xenopus tropicalis]|uniref:Uncharacterized protein C12orf50 homolog isoform X1 n=1 Tax=Xenopus tropicalis TaxID=8364 RepID=A0A8J0SSU3_XENTR|nr:uncharacterized protein C12orf50 homolog isoform X1 [Xenopus tropicalis]XP_031754602.1 uncharacterized protein C12orf50 homolog isoform X1 [Xenopus tropicalis]KAE8614199.1 hypothetical protein XENTR_v10008036 [Xenopus tropicalis]